MTQVARKPSNIAGEKFIWRNGEIIFAVNARDQLTVIRNIYLMLFLPNGAMPVLDLSIIYYYKYYIQYIDLCSN